MRELAKTIVFGGTETAQWVPVGIEAEPDVTVTLRGWKEDLDVSLNAVVASLRPLTFAVGFNQPHELAEFSVPSLSMEFREFAQERRMVGRIALKAVDILKVGNGSLVLFESKGSNNYCLNALQRWARNALHKRKAKQHQKANPFNFEMSQPDLQALLLFYTRPRPVVLVTVQHEESSNIFPMDLIGPTPLGFLLALRSTSPAVELIKTSKRVALSGVPAEQCALAYKLGKHHRKTSIDWNDVSTPLKVSQTLKLPVPAFARSVREMMAEHIFTIGSHTLFITRQFTMQPGASGPSLYHVPGFYACHRQRIGMPLTSAK
jgi:flavin reductase (DIM6/NTAB) family NADH-FMN oxidoreductase RutF